MSDDMWRRADKDNGGRRNDEFDDTGDSFDDFGELAFADDADDTSAGIPRPVDPTPRTRSGGAVRRPVEDFSGEIEFAESFRRRVALLAGLDAAVLKRIAEQLPLTEGAERLCAVLKRLGYRLAILSGGFTFFGRHLQRRLGIDHVHANELEIIDGRLTGRHQGEIVDAAAKARLLREIAAAEGISQRQVIAVGDGANDLQMLSAAGLGIAFHAKPVVRASAGHAISTLGLDALLYMLGLRDWQIEQI
jgi:phosphoserine phosphatase